jgi:hypothetical protein
MSLFQWARWLFGACRTTDHEGLIEPHKDAKRQQLLDLARTYLNESDVDRLRSKVVVDMMLEDDASSEEAEAAYDAAVRALGRKP